MVSEALFINLLGNARLQRCPLRKARISWPISTACVSKAKWPVP
jgi:hypothetical protein